MGNYTSLLLVLSEQQISATAVNRLYLCSVILQETLYFLHHKFTDDTLWRLTGTYHLLQDGGGGSKTTF